MKLINDWAHEVVDKACEGLDDWPRDFIGQEDLVMLIHAAIEGAVDEAANLARKDELAACVEIFSAEFKAYNWRGFKAASDRFSAAIDLIRAKLEENEKSTTNRNQST